MRSSHSAHLPARLLAILPALALAVIATPAPARMEWMMVPMCGSDRMLPLPVRTGDRPGDRHDGQCQFACHAADERRRKSEAE